MSKRRFSNDEVLHDPQDAVSAERRERQFVAYAKGLNTQFVSFMQQQLAVGNGSALQVEAAQQYVNYAQALLSEFADVTGASAVAASEEPAAKKAHTDSAEKETRGPKQRYRPPPITSKEPAAPAPSAAPAAVAPTFGGFAAPSPAATAPAADTAETSAAAAAVAEKPKPVFDAASPAPMFSSFGAPAAAKPVQISVDAAAPAAEKPKLMFPFPAAMPPATEAAAEAPKAAPAFMWPPPAATTAAAAPAPEPANKFSLFGTKQPEAAPAPASSGFTWPPPASTTAAKEAGKEGDKEPAAAAPPSIFSFGNPAASTAAPSTTSAAPLFAWSSTAGASASGTGVSLLGGSTPSFFPAAAAGAQQTDAEGGEGDEEEEPQEEQGKAAVNEDTYDILFTDEEALLYIVTDGKPKKTAKGRLTLRRLKADPASQPFLYMCHAASGKLQLCGSIPSKPKPSVHPRDASMMVMGVVGKPPNSDEATPHTLMSCMFKTSTPALCTQLKDKIVATCK